MFLENFRVPILEGARVTKSGLVQCMLTDRSWATVGKLPEEGRMYDENRNRLMIPNGFYRFSCDYYYRRWTRTRTTSRRFSWKAPRSARLPSSWGR